jgi:hypothetical protein
MHWATIVSDKQITCANRSGQIWKSSFTGQVYHLGSTKRLDYCDRLVILRTAEKNNLAIQILLQLCNQLREQIGSPTFSRPNRTGIDPNDSFV